MEWQKEALEKCLEKTEENIERIGVRFPHVAYHGMYNDQGPSFWVAGFWPGLLWLDYEQTGNPKARELAQKLEVRMDCVLDGFVQLHHDVGFMWMPSAVCDYKLTGRQESKVRGLKAASHLAGRFNLAGRFIRAWTDEIMPDSQGLAIVDCLMNLSLLFWASRETGDPRFYHIAKAHADTVLRNFIREDGTTAHIVRFDPLTGKKLGNIGGQGKSGNSVWARGQAWLIYGMALACRETGDPAYFAASRKCAEYFLSHLPEDRVPYWDFKAEEDERWALDSSAAACAASGLLELAELAGSEDAALYRRQAEEILEGLYRNHFDTAKDSQAILRSGTVHFPQRRHVNVPIIYGDYFFTEALLKLKGKPDIF